ncbi:hypothetical protein NC651_031806 [Populus alba x Populus x berolinensis]|nr:hypothetical protein NC651_031806 [Populus alba x Populus x berolinensis]
MKMSEKAREFFTSFDGAKSPPLSSPQVAVVEYFRHLLAAITQSNRKCKLGQYDSACGYLYAKTSEI